MRACYFSRKKVYSIKSMHTGALGSKIDKLLYMIDNISSCRPFMKNLFYVQSVQVHVALRIQIGNYGGCNKRINNRMHGTYTHYSKQPASIIHVHNGQHLVPMFITDSI